MTTVCHGSGGVQRFFKLTSLANLGRAKDRLIAWQYIILGKPMQNCYVERLSKTRDVLLKETFFFRLD